MYVCRLKLHVDEMIMSLTRDDLETYMESKV